jgi:hypothetical protein
MPTTTKITDAQKHTLALFALTAARLRSQRHPHLANAVLALGRRWWVAQGA